MRSNLIKSSHFKPETANMDQGYTATHGKRIYAITLIDDKFDQRKADLDKRLKDIQQER
jgi:hypothetical protein